VMPARRVEQTLLQRSWTCIQHTHWFAQQVQMSWQAAVAATLPRLRSTYFVTLPAAPAHHTTRLTELARGYQSHCTTVLRTAAFRRSLAERLRLVTTHTAAPTIVQGSAANAIMRSPAGSLVVGQKSMRATDVEPFVVTRVLRHNRRVEEQAVPSERVLLQWPGPQVSEPPLGAAARQTQTQPAGHAGGWSAVAPLPGLNLTHITDEVVRQLDSRLIAARERFGHV